MRLTHSNHHYLDIGYTQNHRLLWDVITLGDLPQDGALSTINFSVIAVLQSGHDVFQRQNLAWKNNEITIILSFDVSYEAALVKCLKSEALPL